RGYTRPAHLASIDIRNGRLTRRQGLQMIEDYEGKRPPSLDLFLQFVGLTEEQFMEIALSHGVSPYQHDPAKVTPGQKTYAYCQWMKEGAMSPAAPKRQLRRRRRQRASAAS